MLAKLIVSASIAAGLIVSIGAVDAKAPPCSRKEIAIKDERPGRGQICLKKTERAKAKRYCAGKDWMGCICQDGNSVGACGN